MPVINHATNQSQSHDNLTDIKINLKRILLYQPVFHVIQKDGAEEKISIGEETGKYSLHPRI